MDTAEAVVRQSSDISRGDWDPLACNNTSAQYDVVHPSVLLDHGENPAPSSLFQCTAKGQECMGQRWTCQQEQLAGGGAARAQQEQWVTLCAPTPISKSEAVNPYTQDTSLFT